MTIRGLDSDKHFTPLNIYWFLRTTRHNLDMPGAVL